MSTNMIAMAPYGATFSPPVAVMLLVDNSGLAQITSAWSDLRDQWLPSIIVRLGSVYPSASIVTFVQESCPSNQQDVFSPRKYYTFQEAVVSIRFSTNSPNHGLSVPLIERSLQFLSNTAAIARHIIIVGSSALNNMDMTSHWNHWARALAAGSIYCHLMLPAVPTRPSEPLSLMFDEALQLQNLAEDDNWLLTDRTKIIPRLSAVRTSAPQVSSFEMTPPISRSRTGSLSAPIERDIPPMSNQSMHGAPASSPPSDEELPSLVTQLQQMHGLTKKKVYSTKPKRRPFVSSEVYREHPRKSSSLSPVSPSDTNHGGRVTSPSVLDRTGRVYYQGGSSVQPSTSTVARSIVDLSGSSHSASAPGSEVGPSAPGSLYPSPTAIPVSPVPSPPSPILNHAPPSWDPSVAIASPPTAVTYQQQPSPPTINTTHAQVGLHSQRGYLTTAPGLSARANTVPNVPPNINPATIPSRHNSVDTHAPSSIGGTHNFQFLGYQGSNEDHLNLSGMNVNTTVGSRANMNYSMPSMQNRHSISAPLYRDSPLERGPPVPVGSQAAMSPSQSIQHQRLQRPERRLTHASSLSEGSNSYSAPALNPYPNSSPWFNNSGSSTAFNSSTSSTISPYAASSASASSSSSSLPASPLVPTSTPTFMSSMPPSALSPYGMSMRLTHPPPPTPLSTPALHATPRYEYDSSASTAASSYPSSPTSSSTSSLTGWAG